MIKEPKDLAWEAFQEAQSKGLNDRNCVWAAAEALDIIAAPLRQQVERLTEQQRMADDLIAGWKALAKALEGALGESLPQIEEWTRAYPEEVSFFAPPNWDDVTRLLGDELLTRVSAANMRHAITRVWEILKPVRDVLAPPATGGNNG